MPRPIKTLQTTLMSLGAVMKRENQPRWVQIVLITNVVQDKRTNHWSNLVPQLARRDNKYFKKSTLYECVLDCYIINNYKWMNS